MSQLVGAAMVVAFLVTAFLMLTGPTGRHCAKRSRSVPPVLVSVIPQEWSSDLPTVEFPVLHVEPIEASYSNDDGLVITVRRWLPGDPDWYELESPIFAELAKEFGYDPVHGFDVLFEVAA